MRNLADRPDPSQTDRGWHCHFMSNAERIGGQLGPLKDPATGQVITGKVYGTYESDTPGPQTQHALVQAMNEVLVGELAAGRIAVSTLEASLPHLYPKIIERCGAQIISLDLKLSLPPSSTAQAPLPPTPQEAMRNALEQQARDAVEPDNREVHAQLRVGGLRINANSKDGIDTEGLKSQLKDKAKSELIWWGAAAFIILLVFVGLIGLGIYIYKEATADPATRSSEVAQVNWDGKKPFSCGGSDNIRIVGAQAELTKGYAIKAGGHCKLELVDIKLKAPEGLYAGGSAQITVRGGSISSSKFAAKALGKGRIRFMGAQVKGKTKHLGPNAKIEGL